MKTYYILTSRWRKRILITKNYNECFDFIMKNSTTRIRTIDYTGKPKILSRVAFFREFFKNTNDLSQLFLLMEKMIVRNSNRYDTIYLMDLAKEYQIYKSEEHKTL